MNQRVLTPEQIEENKQAFLSLLTYIERPGAKIEELKQKLENSDFFYAPASGSYHNAVEGGLCDHCLNVYERLLDLINTVYPPTNAILQNEETGEETLTTVNTCPYSKETLIIVALFHDMSKMNYYEKSIRNKKVYSLELGDKQDNLGRYYWESVPGYATKEHTDRFVFGTHGQTSEYMINCFIPLTLEEKVAIINHMGGFDNDSARGSNLSEIYNHYPLATLLHTADMLATFINERIY